MKIISIDPGYERLGLAILEKKGKEKEILVYSECFKTDKKLSHPERLTLIGNKIEEVIKKHKPESLATEKLFFAKNTKTALFVSEARGVILYCAKNFGLDIFEYTPIDIKIAITSYGRSDKNQIINMVKKLIKINKETSSDDEFDAIAIGLTHLATIR
jgi:crossover junction endodeoxyribonuclease RuvC